METRTASSPKLVELHAFSKLQKHVSSLLLKLILWITETLFLYHRERNSREQKN